MKEVVQNFNMNTKPIMSSGINKPILSENNFSAIVDEIVYNEREKSEILNCLRNHNISSQEIYNWLLNNQGNSNSNSIVLLGDFNYYGIETNVGHLNYTKRLQI